LPHSDRPCQAYIQIDWIYLIQNFKETNLNDENVYDVLRGSALHVDALIALEVNFAELCCAVRRGTAFCVNVVAEFHAID